MLAQATSAVADAGAEYVRAGLLGAACVVLAVVIFYLWRDNKATQKAHLQAVEQLQTARLGDARDFSAQILKVNESYVGTMARLDAALEAHRESDAELRMTLRDLAAEIREGRPPHRR